MIQFIKKNLQIKITLIVTIMVIALFVINAVVSTKQAKIRFESQLDEMYYATAEFMAQSVDDWFSENAGALYSLAAYVKSYDGDVAGMRPFLSQLVSENQFITEAYYGRDDKSAAFSSYNPPADFDITSRGWYSAAKAVNGIYYTQPYVDAITNSLCITMCLSVGDGVVGMDLDLSSLVDILPTTEDGYAMIATDEHNIVLHENPQFSLSGDTAVTLEEAIGGAYLRAMETDELFTDYNGKESYITTEEVQANGWTVALVTLKSIYDKPSKEMVGVFVTLTILFIVISIVVVSLLGYFIAKPITNITKQVNAIADDIARGQGDTSVRIETKNTDEIGMIAAGVNSLMSEFDNLIPKAKSASDTVSGRAQDMVQITDQINDAIAGISQAVEDIANGATQQAQDVQSANESVDHIGEVIDEVKDTAESLNKIAKEMQQASIKTEDQVHDLQEATSTMVSGVDRISDQIKETSRAVDSINDKVSAITEIAEQTNLLSLNASIEAARAGAMGRGFAVVAEEIGKLAVNSAEVAQSIKDEMNALLDKSQAAVDESEKVHDMTVSQSKVLDQTTEAIHGLIGQIGDTIENIGNIETGVQNIVQSRVTIADAMDSLSAISEENAASSEETSATTTEINRTIETLAEASKDLNQVAFELNECLSMFK